MTRDQALYNVVSSLLDVSDPRYENPPQQTRVLLIVPEGDDPTVIPKRVVCQIAFSGRRLVLNDRGNAVWPEPRVRPDPLLQVIYPGGSIFGGRIDAVVWCRPAALAGEEALRDWWCAVVSARLTADASVVFFGAAGDLGP
jgi:hypothetical protein